MLSCFGLCPRRDGDEEDQRQPLLPRYSDVETARQARLQEKLHTYQMLRALSQGYMPSNDQLVTLLRTLLSADVLNPDMPQLSASGRALVRTARLEIKQLIDLLLAKNGGDQIQDLIWCLARARLEVDAPTLRERASASKARADGAAAVASLRTIGSLLLTNAEFRLFLSDLSMVSRSVLKDTAFATSEAARRAGQELEQLPEGPKGDKGDGDGKDDRGGRREGKRPAPPSAQDLERNVADVGGVVSRGAAGVAQEAAQSVKEYAQSEDDKAALAKHLKQAVLNLRQRPDYSESVNALSTMLHRYLIAYSRAASEAIETVEEDVGSNAEADEALKNFWTLITSLGDGEAWNHVKESFDGLMQASQSDPDFEDLVERLSKLVQDMLTTPEFFDNTEERIQEVRRQAREIASESKVGEKLDDLFAYLGSALRSIGQDAEINKLFRTSARLAEILSPAGKYANRELLSDSLNLFLPLVVQTIQYLPIPRLEVASPSIDLLLENLVLEPGKTVNNSSFLPFKMHVSTRNDIDVRKARFRTVSSVATLFSIRLCGLTIAADDLSYWFRLHSGLLRFMDQGIADFHLDERGIDIRLDVEVGRGGLESLVVLRYVDVRIHRLDYNLTKSRFRCLAYLLKPFIRPIVTRALEYQIASAVADAAHFLNRELVFARERLRATRIAGPDDLYTFVRAVAARLAPRTSPDVAARVGVRPGIFRGRYAPGSLVRTWEREGEDAAQKIYEYKRGGWRNDIFGVRTARTARTARTTRTTRPRGMTAPV
ncbi:Uncharacterized protein ESCO_004491 [Escovopsis weberi]|uniref:HAM1-like N-terminal domain-containing protein n=1 Tax=Escovopsis weberi TaxID=150374 RepID=A0A0M8MWS6_ESCWE|nr:Uncharacterized protein ESCO_004491 [Escovopsis weberi]